MSLVFLGIKSSLLLRIILAVASAYLSAVVPALAISGSAEIAA